MKLLVGLVLALLALFVVAERTSVALTPLDWSTISYISEVTLVATKKDLLVYVDQSAGESTPTVKKRGGINPSTNPVMAVRRRNAEGAYVPVGNFTESVSVFAETNGKWVALFGLNSESTIGLFKVDENNNFSNLSTIAANLAGGFLLSDDTFVGFDGVSPLGDGNYTIRTYQYEASNNTWQEIAGTGLVIAFEVNSQPGITSYHVSDTHLVIVDPTNSSSLVVNIYERQVDKSWKFVESVPVNNTAAFVNYNDVDTLIVWSQVTDESGAIGVLFVYTKINGKWTEQKFSTASTGYRPIGYFGVVTSFLNADNLLANIPFDGWSFSGNPPNEIGKVLLITRNDDGVWEPAAELTGGKIFGTGIGVNDYCYRHFETAKPVEEVADRF